MQLEIEIWDWGLDCLSRLDPGLADRKSKIAALFDLNSMESELVTKRLHISGLTPSITSAELSRRLSAFGTVKDLDGFGTLDALGQPRKFAYVTLEGTKAHLAKCELHC